jgi:hypothetical protein
MITEPASAIKRDVLQLIDLQIATLRQESSLDSSQLKDFRARSKRLRELYGELDRIGRARSKAESLSAIAFSPFLVHHRTGIPTHSRDAELLHTFGCRRTR